MAFICEDSPEKGGCSTILDPKTRERLHLREKPTLTEVIAHLKAVIAYFDSSKPPSTSWIGSSCKEIYDFIESLFKPGEPPLDLTQLKNVPCIWNGKTFLKVDSVATTWKIKEGPYLYTTPPHVAANQKFSAALGIREKFEDRDAIRVLEMMKAEFKEEPVSDSCKELITELMLIFDDISQDQVKKPNSAIYLLDTLRLATNLHYNDAQWMDMDTEYSQVNSKLSRTLATKLGVRLVRSKRLDHFVSKRKHHFGVSFGKHDKLTRTSYETIQLTLPILPF